MVLMMIHKLGLMLAIIFGFVYLAKRTEPLKWLHRIFGLLTIVSFIVYIIVKNFTNSGYILYALLLLAASLIPYLYKRRAKTAVHLSLVAASIVWLVLIHVV
ncbi:hypothetical protein [Pradoshia sp.]|uniref:hypothetical protein n=1 Tax=Pradoshia sp. TaxID=2651281 RepID=UPI003F03B5B0